MIIIGLPIMASAEYNVTGASLAHGLEVQNSILHSCAYMYVTSFSVLFLIIFGSRVSRIM